MWHAETTCDKCKRNRAPCYVALIDGAMQVQPPPGWCADDKGIACPGCQLAQPLAKPTIVMPTGSFEVKG